MAKSDEVGNLIITILCRDGRLFYSPSAQTRTDGLDDATAKIVRDAVNETMWHGSWAIISNLETKHDIHHHDFRGVASAKD